MSHHPGIRVLLWSPGGAGLHYGGPGTSAFRLYSSAESGRFQVSLAHGCSIQESYNLFREQSLIAPVGHSTWSQVRFLSKAYRWLNARAGEFDVFSGLEGFELTVGPALHAQRLGLPAIVKIAAHQSDLASKSGLKGLLRLPERRRRRLREISGVVAISSAIASELQSYGIPDEKIVRIPNAVNTEWFRPADPVQRARARASLGWPDVPTVLFVGAIHPRKNPMLLVEVMGVLKSMEIRLVLVGPEQNAAYCKAMKRRAVELGVADRIDWIGFCRDVAPLYQASDIYALPSSIEGMPNALLEAMSSGLACIGTPISGIADLLEDGVSGRIVAAESGVIADAVRDYVESPRLAQKHGRAARQTIEATYSTPAVLDAYERLFRRIMAGEPAADAAPDVSSSPSPERGLRYTAAQ